VVRQWFAKPSSVGSIPTSASSRDAPFVSGGCANFPLRGWLLISGKPEAAFPPPPPS
jgi:hypothetical protein